MRVIEKCKWLLYFLALGMIGISVDAAAQTTVQLNLLYVHGVENSTTGKQGAGNALKDLEASVNTALASKISAYQTAHPDVTIVLKSARVNLYTATASPSHPSNSAGPLYMDDWKVGGCSSTTQGQPCTTAYEWRWRLANQIKTVFGAGAKNIIVIGHSTGARTAMEVTANMGTGGVGSQDWGVQSMVAGVVTVHGMLDALNGSNYNFVGWSSFDVGCEGGGYLVDAFSSGTAPGWGWCEYAGNISGFPAADWVATNKTALMLTGWASCSPSLWTGWSDGALPFAAQGSSKAVGTSMAPAPGTTYRPAHGTFYGSYCHSDISNGNSANHTSAVNAATNQISNWLFSSAPRVAVSGSLTTPTLSYGQTSSLYTVGSSCPSGRIDGSITVVGNCSHPGYFDGDDHRVSDHPAELVVSNGSTCNGTFKWTQNHDTSNSHAATFWYKSYSLPASGGLVGILAPN